MGLFGSKLPLSNSNYHHHVLVRKKLRQILSFLRSLFDMLALKLIGESKRVPIGALSV